MNKECYHHPKVITAATMMMSMASDSLDPITPQICPRSTRLARSRNHDNRAVHERLYKSEHSRSSKVTH